jgi:hypothetical protein
MRLVYLGGADRAMKHPEAGGQIFRLVLSGIEKIKPKPSQIIIFPSQPIVDSGQG